jgi:gluconolactonase
MSEPRVLATGLRFPEGPVWLSDGSVALVEIARGTITIVDPKGGVRVLATPGGGPNGLAVGPDGAFYCCNNGGFIWLEVDGKLRPGLQPPDYSGGRIERIDAKTGAVTKLYESCGHHRLRGPNDIVFDNQGGFYFTDLGKSRARDMDHGGVYYAHADGSHIVELAHPLITPNGIGLSPDGKTVYVAETRTARIWAFDLESPGVAKKYPLPAPHGGRFIAGLGGYQMFDSLKVDADGNICVATLVTGAVTVIAPDGRVLRVKKFEDPTTTNIAFGGADQRTAYVTLSSIGQLVAIDWTDRDWSVPGLKLNYVI